MREFKFRVWENVESKMNYDCIVGDNFIIFNYTGDCEDDLFTGDADFVHLCELNRKYFTIMQYTGIKDMYGKEIYEGDILAHQDYWWIRIEYDSGSFMVRDVDKVRYNNKICNIPIGDFDISKWRVIGNIYENKDLLE